MRIAGGIIPVLIGTLVASAAACRRDSALDSGPSPDGSVSTDGGSVEDGGRAPDGGAICRVGATDIRLGPVPPLVDDSKFTYEGDARVLSHAPAGPEVELELELPDAGTLVLGYRAGTHGPLAVEADEVVEADIRVSVPFWTEAAVALRRSSPGTPTDGELIGALWTHSGPPVSVAELSATYVDRGCPPYDFMGTCGDFIPLILVVSTLDGTESVEVGAGREASIGGFAVGNSSWSGFFPGDVFCTDLPASRAAGYIIHGP